MQLIPQVPPDVLYHGTGHKSVASIIEAGLCKMSGHHVHLSVDIITAQKVGGRHVKPVVFVVNTVKMQKQGFTFYWSDNGVWLVDSVPPQYLKILANER
ncbi:COG1859: RNA:NAD 2'-phosphotransferase [Richelia intracellularis]|nr:COG1859: RNA:NAD 2'-phosphotransferase [Richelia intracellularis]